MKHRELLKTSGAAAGAVGLAGCLNGEGGGGDTGTEAVTPIGTPNTGEAPWSPSYVFKERLKSQDLAF
jgi:hypothetical protein